METKTRSLRYFQTYLLRLTKRQRKKDMSSILVCSLIDFFVGSPDRCERAISCLQYCTDRRYTTEGNKKENDGDRLYNVLEKGIFYRGMIPNIESLHFSEQLSTVISKFTEFEISLIVPDICVEVCRPRNQIATALNEVIADRILPNPIITDSEVYVPYVLLDNGSDLAVLSINTTSIDSAFDVLLIANDVRLFRTNGLAALLEDFCTAEPCASSVAAHYRGIDFEHIYVQVLFNKTFNTASQESYLLQCHQLLEQLRQLEHAATIQCVRKYVTTQDPNALDKIMHARSEDQRSVVRNSGKMSPSRAAPRLHTPSVIDEPAAITPLSLTRPSTTTSQVAKSHNHISSASPLQQYPEEPDASAFDMDDVQVFEEVRGNGLYNREEDDVVLSGADEHSSSMEFADARDMPTEEEIVEEQADEKDMTSSMQSLSMQRDASSLPIPSNSAYRSIDVTAAYSPCCQSPLLNSDREAAVQSPMLDIPAPLHAFTERTAPVKPHVDVASSPLRQTNGSDDACSPIRLSSSAKETHNVNGVLPDVSDSMMRGSLYSEVLRSVASEDMEAIRDKALRQCMEFDDEESEVGPDVENEDEDNEDVDFDLIGEYNNCDIEDRVELCGDDGHDAVARARSNSWEIVEGGDIALGDVSEAEEQLRYTSMDQRSMNENSQLMAAEDMNILAVADESMLEGDEQDVSPSSTVRDNIEHLHDEYSSPIGKAEDCSADMFEQEAKNITGDIITDIINNLHGEYETPQSATALQETSQASATIDENIVHLSGEYAKENWRHDERRLSEDFESAPEELAALTEHLRLIYAKQCEEDEVGETAEEIEDRIGHDDDVEELLQDMGTPHSRLRALSADLSYEAQSPVNAPESYKDSDAPIQDHSRVPPSPAMSEVLSSPRLSTSELRSSQVVANDTSSDVQQRETYENVFPLSQHSNNDRDTASNALKATILGELQRSRESLIQQQQIREFRLVAQRQKVATALVMQHFPQYLATRAGTIVDRKKQVAEPPKWRLPQPPNAKVVSQSSVQSTFSSASESIVRRSGECVVSPNRVPTNDNKTSIESPSRRSVERIATSHADSSMANILTNTQVRESEMETIRTTALPPPPATRMTVRTGLMGGPKPITAAAQPPPAEPIISPPKSLREHLQITSKRTEPADTTQRIVMEPRVLVQRPEKREASVVRPQSPVSYSAMYRARVDDGEESQATYDTRSTHHTSTTQSTAGTHQSSHHRRGEKIELGGGGSDDAEKIRAKFERKTEKLRMENEKRKREKLANDVPASSRPRDSVDAAIRALEMEVSQLQPPSQSGMRSQSAGRARPESFRGIANATAKSPTKPRAVSAQRSRSAPRGTKQLNNIRNALNNICLAGQHHALQREETLQLIDEYVASRGQEASVHFVIILHESKMLSFKGLYASEYRDGEHVIRKLTGWGPTVLPVECIQSYYKYESSTKSFKKLMISAVTNTCDAVSVDTQKLKRLLQKHRE